MRLANRFVIEAQLVTDSKRRVFSAFDERRECPVALEVLGRLTPPGVAGLEREFRAASELDHPNLAQLRELGRDGNEWFYTMDPLSGLPLREVLQRERLEVSVVCTLFRQLASALTALQDASPVRRPFEASSIWLTSDTHHVTLLHFGIARDGSTAPSLKRAGSGKPTSSSATVASPRSAHGTTRGARDWHAFGALLYESLTGKPPALELDPRALTRTPAGLAALCLDLLQPRAAARPAGPQVLERLDAAVEQTARNLFVGRQTELARLNAAFEASVDGRCSAILVQGPAGIGKTTLVAQFAEIARLRGATVLQGRCREHESVDYQAASSVMDRVAAVLSECSRAELEALLPPGVELLSLLFPTLRSIGSIADRSYATDPKTDRATLRLRAVQAFVQLMQALRQRGPLIVWVDDLQWSDRESAWLFEPLLSSRRAVPLLFVGGCRVDGGLSASLPIALTPLGDATALQPERLQLGPMFESDIAALVRSELLAPEPDRLAAIVSKAKGHPLLAKALAHAERAPQSVVDVHELEQSAPAATRRAAAGTAVTALAQLLERRVSSLPSSARHALELLALAAPLRRDRLRQLLGTSPTEFEQILGGLLSLRLICTAGPHEHNGIELYHHAFAEAIVGGLTPELREQRHRSIAHMLLESAHPRHGEIAAHLEAGGEPEPAAIHWLEAGDEAVAALAFERAADLYERGASLARAVPRQRDAFRIQQATALAQAGQSTAAAAVYLALVRDTGDETQRLSYQLRAAEQLLYAGYLHEGFRLADEIARAVGLSSIGRRAASLPRTLVDRLRVRMRSFDLSDVPKRTPSASERLRLDVAWLLSSALSLIDPINAARFHNAHLLSAVDSGDTLHLLRALTFEAPYISLPGGRLRERSDRLLRSAERIAKDLGDERSWGLLSLMRALSAYLQGDAEYALVQCELALDRLRDCRDGAWEVISAHRFAIAASFLLGHFARLAQSIPQLLESAESTGNRYAGMCFRSGFGTIAWLVKDQRAQARAQIDLARSECTSDVYDLSHYHLLVGETFLLLYEGHEAAALECIERHWRRLVSSHLLRVGVVRVHASQILGLTLCDAASRAYSHSDSHAARRYLRRARRLSARLRHDPMPRAAIVSHLIETAAQLASGSRERARLGLAAAIDAFDASRMVMYAASARLVLSQLASDDDRALLLATGQRAFAAEGVTKPWAMTQCLLPGFGARRLVSTHGAGNWLDPATLQLP